MNKNRFIQTEDEDLSIVLLGSFNPHIFHPEWFIRQKLINEEITNDVTVNSKEVTQIQLGETKLTCTQDRLTLGTDNLAYAERVLDLIDAILRLLPHTPVTAIGINYKSSYLIQDSDLWNKIGHTLAPKELIWNNLGDNPGMQSLEILYPIRKDEAKGGMRILVAPLAQNKTGFRINRHFDIKTESNQGLKLSNLTKDFLEDEYNSAKNVLKKTVDLIESKILK